MVLIAVIGGISLGSIAGARNSEAAYPKFLKSTNPSNLDIDVGDYSPSILRAIAKLPDVTSIQTYVSPNAAPVTASGKAEQNSPEVLSNFDPIASVGGLYFSQDRLTILHGRLANPRSPDEIMINEFAAKYFGLHVGEVIRYGFFANSQLNAYGSPTSASTRVFKLRITGIGVANTEIVQDQIDKVPIMILTPALTRQLIPCCITYAWSGLQLRQGARDVAKVESDYLHLLPPGYPYYFHVTSVIEDEAQQAVKPEAFALAVFGVIAGLSTLIVAMQIMARQIHETREEREVMRYIGASPLNTSTDMLVGFSLAVVAGTALAMILAVGLSPLLLFGPIQSVIPSHGFSVDWTVLGVGAVVLIGMLVGAAALLNWRSSLRLRSSRAKVKTPHSSSIARAASLWGFPLSATLGIRYSLESGRGRRSVPVRSSIFASLLAIILVVGTLTFGSSLHELTSTPRLYGWNWNVMIESDAGYGNVPQPQATKLLDADKSVAAAAGIYFDSLLFNGQAVPVVGTTTSAEVAPALLAGHEVAGRNQVVVGPETLAALHKHLGNTVRVTGGSRSVTLRIVGVATMPTVGIGFGLHLSIGSGAFVDYNLIPTKVRTLLGLPFTGPNAYLIRFDPRVALSAAEHSLRTIVNSLNSIDGGGSNVLTYRNIRPAEITNYESMGSTPLLLAAGLALGAIAALTLTLLSSVRRRRRDLALLKALGLTRRQVAAVIAWQSTVAVVLGVVIGIPVGIEFGRVLWNLFAHELFAIPEARVPSFAVALVAVGSLILAFTIALVPAWQASRTASSQLARVE